MQKPLTRDLPTCSGRGISRTSGNACSEVEIEVNEAWRRKRWMWTQPVLEVPYSAHHVAGDIEECLRANLEARSGVDITLWSYTESIHRESTESAVEDRSFIFQLACGRLYGEKASNRIVSITVSRFVSSVKTT